MVARPNRILATGTIAIIVLLMTSVAVASLSPGQSAWLPVTLKGIPTSTAQNPIHGYQTTGTYSVALTVTGASAQNTPTKPNYITVIAPTPNSL